MGILSGRFGKSKVETPSTATPVICPHTVLLPRWDNVSDMGAEDKISSYTCQSCHESFSAEEGRSLRAQESERLRREFATSN